MKKLFKALADFQQEVPIIHKGAEGYGYSYAPLPEIMPVINPLLKKNGLGFTQLAEGQTIKTILFHCESGETLQSITDIPQGVQLAKMNDFQVLGSAITYIRRYALSAMLGLVTDKDTNGGGKQIDTKDHDYKKVWLSETQLNQIIELGSEKIEGAIAFYDGKTVRKDGTGEFIACMKKDYKQTLQNTLKQQ